MRLAAFLLRKMGLRKQCLAGEGGEVEVEFASFAEFGDQSDASTVEKSDFPGDGESESSSGPGLSGYPEEFFKNPFLVFTGNSGSLIDHAEPDLILENRLGPKGNGGACGGVLAGIGNKIGENVACFFSISCSSRRGKISTSSCGRGMAMASRS